MLLARWSGQYDGYDTSLFLGLSRVPEPLPGLDFLSYVSRIPLGSAVISLLSGALGAVQSFGGISHPGTCPGRPANNTITFGTNSQ